MASLDTLRIVIEPSDELREILALASAELAQINAKLDRVLNGGSLAASTALTDQVEAFTQISASVATVADAQRDLREHSQETNEGRRGHD